MYCNNCGTEMPNDAIFCSHCGTRLVPAAPVAAETPVDPAAPVAPKPEAQAVPEPAARPAAPVASAPAKPEEEAPRKPFMEEMQWNVSEYPDSNVVEKTEDIDFNWNANPAQVPDKVEPQVKPRPQPAQPEEPKKSAEGIRVSEIFDRVVPVEEAKAAVEETGEPETQKAAKEGAEPDRFYTVHRKNAEFQELLKREHDKINMAGTIGSEQSQADALAKEKFDSRQEEMTMDQFLEKEGAVKLYEPKPLESDVLARIEAQEKRRARQKAEEEARTKALEEARVKAEAKTKAELDRLNSEVEASAAAAEEIRLAEEAEIRQRTEEEARRKAAAQAAHLEAIAQRQAAQEQAALQEQERRAAEEARAKAEAEQRAREEAAAKARAEAEAARAAEEEARRKAEAELNAAREAAKIRAQQEANMAAREEARFHEEQRRRQYEEEMLRQKQALRAREQERLERQEREAAVETEVKDALAQTARMREEEEAKIRAALAGIRGGRFSDIDFSTAGQQDEPAGRVIQPVEILQAAAPAAVPVAETLRATQEVPEVPAEPAFEAPAAPAFEAPIFETPAEPVFEAPAFAEPASEAPAEPVIEAPAFGMPEEIAEAVPEAKIPAEPVTTSQEQIEEAHRMTQSHIDEMAKARENFFADFPDAEEVVTKADAIEDLGQTKVVNKDDLLTNIESTKVISREAMQAEEAAQPEEFQKQIGEMDDLLSQFVSMHEATKAPAAEEPASQAAELSGFDEPVGLEAELVDVPAAEEVPAAAPIEDQIQEGSDGLDHMFTGFQMDAEDLRAAAAGTATEVPYAAEDLAEEYQEAAPAEEALEEKPGLEDTMVIPMPKAELAAAIEGAGDLSPKERKRLEKEQAKEAKRLAKEQKQEAKRTSVEEDFDGIGEYADEPVKPSKGGVGRTILMIILIILCIIFALELAGIGIKLLAPTSGAAEFIDNILNNMIHMITG